MICLLGEVAPCDLRVVRVKIVFTQSDADLPKWDRTETGGATVGNIDGTSYSDGGREHHDGH